MGDQMTNQLLQLVIIHLVIIGIGRHQRGISAMIILIHNNPPEYAVSLSQRRQ